MFACVSGLRGVSFLATATLVLCGLVTAQPAPRETLPAEEFKRSYIRLFEAASAEADVPVEILEAIAFVETRWSHTTEIGERHPDHDGPPPSFGIMGLRDDDYFGHSLRTAAALIHRLPEDVIADPELNIRAAAAFLAQLAGGLTREASLEEWRSAIERYSGIPQEAVRAMYSYDVYRSIHLGRSAITQRHVAFDALYGPEMLRILSAPMVYMENVGGRFRISTNATDYSGAIWTPACDGGPSGENFAYGRTEAVTHVAIHITDGTYSSAISWFQDCNRPAGSVQSSAHYVIRSSDGQITQMVLEANTAYHVSGNNSYSIGIEHEARLPSYCSYMTSAMYSASAGLLRDICARTGINCNTVYDASLGWDAETSRTATWKIKGHTNFPNTSKSCPTSCWDWPTYRGYVLTPSTAVPSVTTTSASGLTSSSATLNATVTSDGGSAILERRLEWGIAPNWTSFTSSVSVSGSDFSYTLNGLPANTGYQFRGWARNSLGWGMGNTRTFSTTASNPCFALTRTHTGQGSDPSATPSNSTGCSSGQYVAGENISLSASPASGWSVGSWSGTNNNSSTSTSNSLTMPSSSRTVSVGYIQNQPNCYSLGRTHTGSGGDPSATPSNSTGCGSGQYVAGALISLTASPASGWAVGGWLNTNNDSSTSLTNSLTMPASSRTVSVTYVLIQPPCYSLTRTHTGQGTDPTAAPSSSSGCSSGQYVAGQSITLNASPASGWAVSGWSGTNNDASTLASNSLTMPSAGRTVSVAYSQSSTCSISSLSCPATIDRSLTTSSCTQGARSAFHYSDLYSFVGSAGSSVTINLSSGQFDSFLYLLAPDGTVAAWDDDSGGGVLGYDSRIVHTLPVSGTWKIHVTTYGEGETGSYRLTLNGCTVSRVRADFNLDGRSDILWRNMATGVNYLWYMNGNVMTAGAYTPSVTDFSWVIAGIGDVNGDQVAEILWRNNATGQNYIWFMNNNQMTSGAFTDSVTDFRWGIIGCGDFNGDGRDDILWRNSVTGENFVWFMNGATHTGGSYLGSVTDFNWKAVAVADFNRDGHADVLWRNTSTGQNYLWRMSGVTMLGGDYLNSVLDMSWSIASVGDFDGDLFPDVLWRNANGTNYIWFQNNAATVRYGWSSSVSDFNWIVAGPR